MAPRPLARTDLHVRLPIAGHEALVAYAEREGVSLNTALWLLVRRGLEREGVSLTAARRPDADPPPVVGHAGAIASAAVELVERALADVEAPPTAGPAASSTTPPPRPGRRRRRRR